MAYSLTAIERETIITFNDADNTAEVYTSNPVWIRKFDKLCEQNSEQFENTETDACEGRVVSKRYKFPKKFVTIRSKEVRHEISEEQKRINAERLKAFRTKQKQQNQNGGQILQ